MKKIKRYRRVLPLTLMMSLIINIMFSGVLMISAGAKEYNSGSSIYVGDLKVGDIIGNGSVLHPSMEARMGVTTAELTIDGKQIKIRQSAAETYTTDRPLRVDSIKYSVYSKNICAYSLKTYDEENDLQKTYKNHSHIYVGDMKVGDIVGAGATLHTSGDGSGCSAFEVYLDESSKRANDSYFEWCPSQPIRLVSTEKDFYSPNKLIMRFETFYAEGEVGSEASLNAALNRDEVIVLANNIELSDCFFVRDGKEHTLDLNGYTLSRNMASKTATGHVFQVNKGSKLTIKDSSTEHSGLITGGFAPNGGGAYIDGALILEGGVIAGNTADNGGGLFVRGGSVTINKNAVIEDNVSKNGGGIYNSGELTVKSGKVNSNIAGQSGAGIWSKGTADLKKAEIVRNNNAENGGGMINYGTMTLSGCTVAGNSAKNSGGGIMLAEGSRTSFSDNNGIGQNYAQDGGIFVGKCTIDLKDTALEGNIASGLGGALWLDSDTSVELVNVNISSNSSTANGAGIYTKGTLSLTDCKINSCTGGSGVYFDSDKQLTLKNASVTGNAGGIYMNVGSVVLAGGRIIVDENMKNSAYSNLTFKSFKKITVTGEFYPESKIGITPPDNWENRDLTENYSDFNEANADTYERIQLKNYPCKAGYYINNYVASGACFIEANDDGTYTFAFGKEDIVLTATLKGIRYTIEFEKNGDPLMEGKDVTCVMVSKTLTYGKAAVALPKCYYKREGYTFTGWNTKADGTGTNYADKEKVKDLTTVPNDVIHLYAQWKLTSPPTTASIFSDGNLIIYIGCAVILVSVITAVIYSVKRKKSRRTENEEESA